MQALAAHRLQAPLCRHIKTLICLGLVLTCPWAGCLFPGQTDQDSAQSEARRCPSDRPLLKEDMYCAERESGTLIFFPANGIPRGSCRYGLRACVDGKWSPCRGAVAPLLEDRCDIPGNDDNCNGIPNQGCSQQSDP